MSGSSEDKREQRRDYHIIQEEMENKSVEIPSGSFTEYRAKINELFAQVSNVRELGIDADVLLDLAKSLRLEVQRLDSDCSEEINFPLFARRLRARYAFGESGEGDFDWTRFGAEVGALYRRVPEWKYTFFYLLVSLFFTYLLSTMMGPLDREVKERKKPERRARIRDDGSEEEKPEEEQQAGGDNADTAARQRIARLEAALPDQRDPPGELLDLVLDPLSAVQTVENLFDLSFLVKDRKVELGQSPDGTVTVCRGIFPPDAPRTQTVLSLPMSGLMALGKQRLEVAPVCRLHREDPLYQARDAHSQVALIEADNAEAKRSRTI
jgi:hypothetical protein